jgi:predicted nucleic acid-binding protein
MPQIVSNTSPLIHLAKIGQLNLLPEFFGDIANKTLLSLN